MVDKETALIGIIIFQADRVTIVYIAFCLNIFFGELNHEKNCCRMSRRSIGRIVL